MIEELVSLTEKERQRIFLRGKKRGTPKQGDYITYGGDIYKVVFFNKDSKSMWLEGDRCSDIVNYNRDSFMPLTEEHFSNAKSEWIIRKLSPTTEEKSYSFLKNTLSSVYPEERFDIMRMDSRKYRVIIHYPEITISNSVEISHTIRDLYFSFYIRFNNDGFIRIDEFKVARTTFEDREYSDGDNFYIFSHLRTNTSPWVLAGRTFCFGHTKFGEFVSSLARGREKFTELKKFLYGMNSCFQWESLEGIPYHKIMNIGEDRFETYTEQIDDEYVSSQAASIMSQMTSFTFSIYDSYINIDSINDGEPADTFISSRISNLPENMMCYTVNGNYVNGLREGWENNARKFENIEANFYFKGIKPKMKILETEVSLGEKVVNIALINAIKEKIAEKFKQYLLLNYE